MSNLQVWRSEENIVNPPQKRICCSRVCSKKSSELTVSSNRYSELGIYVVLKPSYFGTNPLQKYIITKTWGKL